ncbi:MAG TPA: nucleoside-diphosphate sugar epimerase/dehydratase [bacterium]|jgi:FlaA1/EpsC-like NDP-sugar epimerase|nr:nucleoside-diphosphate sugar epimerase/dehydratase [bacterium]
MVARVLQSDARRLAIILMYAAFSALAYLLAFALRFDFAIPARQAQMLYASLPLVVVIQVGGLYFFGMHRGLWRYASVGDLLTIVKATLATSLVFIAAAATLYPSDYPRSVYLLDWGIFTGALSIARVGALGFRDFVTRIREGTRRRVVLVGAGDGAEMLLRELDHNPFAEYRAVALVDDDARKRRTSIRGVEVLGGIDDLAAVCARVQASEVIIAIPSASRDQLRRIAAACRQTGLRYRRIPALADIMKGTLKAVQLQEVRPEDLLDREVAQVDLPAIERQLSGRRVVITGAAGSIGSELARHVAGLNPERLVLMDRAESNLYLVSLELRERHPALLFSAAVGDILNAPRVRELFREHRPEIVYHAAAYKHVPLMEEHPLEAIENNIFGTEILAREAARAGVETFILISTDKAVEPVSVMGMTKRIAELVLRSVVSEATSFVAVRFGNVLGSDGSVLPLFKWQAATKGELTVTDPEAARYFMLPAEAVQLVLTAGRMGGNGDTFFLNMGEPVRIMDLATRFLSRSGLEPEVDVKIAISGLRPGERLGEILVAGSEQLLPTDHDRIFRIGTAGFDREAFVRDLEVLKGHVLARDSTAAVGKLKEMAAAY